MRKMKALVLSAVCFLLLVEDVLSAGVLLQGRDVIRAKRDYYPYMYNSFYPPPFFSSRISPNPFYQQNRQLIPFNPTLYYNNVLRGYRTYRNDVPFISRHRKVLGQNIKNPSRQRGYSIAVPASKRSFGDGRFRNAVWRKNAIGNIPGMIDIPFKQKLSTRKYPTKKDKTRFNTRKHIETGQKRQVFNYKQPAAPEGHKKSGFIVESDPNKHQNKSHLKTEKKNVTHSSIIDEIVTDKKNDKTSIVTNKTSSTAHQSEKTFRRNATNLHTANLKSSPAENMTLIRSANLTAQSQTKGVLKDIKNGVKNAWQGAKNFTSYLLGPSQGKQNSSHSKQSQSHKSVDRHDLKHDAAKEDWFGVEEVPDEKTQNDLNISKDKFFTELVNKKMTRNPQKNAKNTNNKKNSENHVKKLVDLVEESEHEELKNLVQDSVGSPLKDELKRIPLSKENAKEVDKEKTAYLGAAESNEINKLIADYKDDFDVFVDKSVNKESDADFVQAKGEVMDVDKTLPDIDSQFDTSLTPNDASDDVTGKKKNELKNTYKTIEEVPTAEETSNILDFPPVVQKWQQVKESNHRIFENERKRMQDEMETSAPASPVVKSIPTDHKNKNQQRQDVLDQYFSQVQNEQVENQQRQRRHRINATLNMLSDIENQIDGIIKGNKDAQDEYVQNSPAFQMANKPTRRGKAVIFQEMMNGGNNQNNGQLAADFAQQQQQNIIQNTKAVMAPNDGGQESEGTLNTLATIDHVQPEANDGRIIDSAVTNSDNVDHILQANALKNLQNLEMSSDLQRMKEVTQNGLREMFSNAVNKQQLFMNQMQGQGVVDPPQPSGLVNLAPQETLLPQFSPRGGSNLLTNGVNEMTSNRLLTNAAETSANLLLSGRGQAPNVQFRNGASDAIGNQFSNGFGRFLNNEFGADDNAEEAANGQLIGAGGASASPFSNGAEEAGNSQILNGAEDATTGQLSNDAEEAGNGQLINGADEATADQLPNGAEEASNNQLINGPEQAANGQLANDAEGAGNGQLLVGAEGAGNGQLINGAEEVTNGQLTNGFVNNEGNTEQGLDVIRNNNERRSRIDSGDLTRNEGDLINDFLDEE